MNNTDDATNAHDKNARHARVYDGRFQRMSRLRSSTVFLCALSRAWFCARCLGENMRLDALLECAILYFGL